MRTGSRFEEKKKLRHALVVPPQTFIISSSFPILGFANPSCQAECLQDEPPPSQISSLVLWGTEHGELTPRSIVTGKMPLAFTGLGFQPNECSVAEKLRAKHTHRIQNIHLQQSVLILMYLHIIFLMRVFPLNSCSDMTRNV